MSAFSSFRFVPPLSPKAIAIAILVVAAFVGAQETSPQLMGNAVDPLALALAVHLFMTGVFNLTKPKVHGMLRQVPMGGAVLLIVVLVGLFALLLWGTAGTAAMLMIIWVLINALHLTWAISYDPDWLKTAPTPFNNLKTHREQAVLMEAAGLVITAATLLSAWVHGGAFLFVIVMAPGRLLLRMLTQWIIVLYLLDAQARESDNTD